MLKNNKNGFSLLELLIVMVIIALLASLGVGEYQSFIRKSRRSDAQTTLLAHHALLQHCYLRTFSYVECGEELELDKISDSFSGYYFLQLNEATDKNYILQATAQNGQEKDLLCYRFTLTAQHQRRAFKKDGAPAPTCWGNT